MTTTKPTTSPRERYCVLVPKVDLALYRKISRNRGLTTAELVRRALSAYLNELGAKR